MPKSIEERKEAKRRYQAAYREKYPERVRAQKKAYDQAHVKDNSARSNAWRKQNQERARTNGRNSTKRYRESHPDKIKAYAASEPQRARVKQWSKANYDRHRASIKQWAEDHPDRVRAYCRNWRKTHPEKTKAAQRCRAARLRGAIGEFTEDDVRNCLLMQGWRCFYCLVSLVKGYHLDHMTPLCRGGSNGADNIVCACPPCNLKKGKKTAAEFILGVDVVHAASVFHG